MYKEVRNQNTMESLSFFNFCLLLILSSFIAGHSKQQQSDQYIIKRLPGQPGAVSFSQYAGHVTLNKASGGGHALFFYFVEATTVATAKPLVLWLNGGPGCSSIAGGAFLEVGPFWVRQDGRTLALRPTAWNTEANLLFVESPVGVGFSYSNTSQIIGDKSTAEDAYQFLINWLEIFPQYKGRDFYIAGESYAGHYIPQLSSYIVQRFKARTRRDLNFKGFLLGNPAIDTYNDYMGMFESWWNHGLVSNSLYKKLKESCKSEPLVKPKGKCNVTMINAIAGMGKININSIYEPPCKDEGSHTMNFGENNFCLLNATNRYMNQIEVQNAMHVQSCARKSPWKHCSNDVFNNWGDSATTTLPLVKNLIQAGYKIWIYSGDTDAMLPLSSTRYSVNALNLTIGREWYTWYQDGEIGGWAETYKGLTFVTIKGAGHMVPLYRPRQAFQLFKKFLNNGLM